MLLQRQLEHDHEPESSQLEEGSHSEKVIPESVVRTPCLLLRCY